MKDLILFLLLLGAVTALGCSFPSHPEEEEAGVAVAKAWVLLVDKGQYEESWDQASQYFKNAVDKGQWVQTMESVRKPFGRNLSRDVASKQFRTTLPGAPDGQYVIIQFDASFEKKASAVETVTAMFDQDGQWHVSGYYMK